MTNQEGRQTVTIIVPCYNEEQVLPLFLAAMAPVRQALEAECFLLFVDDGSKDHTLSLLRETAEKDDHVEYLSFSRNFGKEAAMLAGLTHAKGDYVVIMDADLQDPPEMILRMYDILQKEDVDCVATRRTDRKGEPPVRSFFARMFYRMINRISKTEIVDGARDFRMMSRRMVDAILQMGEYNRFSKGIFSWVGFRTHWLEYVNRQRAAGETKWSFWKLFLYSMDGITAFSTAPLALSSFLGVFCCIISMIYLVVVFVKALLFGDPVAGYPSLACIILFLGGVQLLCIGILGQYLSKTYLEVKDRPPFILAERCLREEKKGDVQ